MALHPFLNAFTTGEITDQLIARTTWDNYRNAAACLKNFVVRPYGGAARRAGTHYLGAVKVPSERVRLVRFAFNITQVYVLEFGHFYVRVWANRAPVLVGGVPVEVVTPYTVEELRELRFEQSADVLYIAHRHHPPSKLQRTAADAFQLDVINFNPPALFEQEIFPFAALSMTSAAIGNGIVFTASAPAWLAGDVGRQIKSGVGRAVITTFTDSTHVVGTILDAFDTTGPIASQAWRLDGSPNAGTLTPTVAKPVNAATQVTASLAAFRTTDVGRFVLFNDGIIKLTTFTSDTVMQGVIVKELTGVTAAPVGVWTLESNSWTSILGFPGVVALHGQRLWWAGSDSFPGRVWGSAVADYENHGRGVADDDAVEYELATSGVNLVRWLKALPDGLGVGTLAGEITLDGGGTNAPMTPTNVQARERTFYGSDYTVDALRTSNLVLFLQRGSQRVRELTVDPQSVNSIYVAPDLCILAEQLTRAGIVEMDHASSPDSLIFALTNLGVLLSCAYERRENVIGWSHHETDGLFESLAVIPNNCGSGDELWVSVNRTIPGGAYFHSDFFATGYFHPNYFALAADVERRGIEVFDGAMNTDAGLVYSGVAAGTFTGLAHLDGLTVKAVTADGTVYDLVVAGDSITLPDGVTTTELEVGLHYTSTLTTLRPELQGPAGTAQGRRKHWNQVIARVYCTRGPLLLNGVTMIEYPEGWDVDLDYTGDLSPMVNFGWNREGQLTIQTTEPKPCTILALTGKLEMDDA